MARSAAKRVEEPHIEGDEIDDTQVVDETSQEAQSQRTGQIAQGDEDFITTLARQAKWVPKEEWKRDPHKWVDAKTYLQGLPQELDTLKERNRRTAQAAADAVEEANRRARIEAEAAVRAAAEAQDPEAAAAAAKQLAQASGPPPQTLAWIGRNPWFNEDPDAQAMAVAEINRLAASKASIEDQLEGAEAKIRKRFPEYFGQAERTEPAEARLSEVRPAPPAVQRGTRGGESRPKEKGYADIPPGDKASYIRYFAKNYESYGLKPEEAQARYAKAYWANKDEA